MNYEQKYKEALERMKSWVRGEHPEGFSEAQKAAEFIFPELKESEDEKIRKVLLNDFKNNCSEYYCEGINRDMIIAWLEKQGEKKPYEWHCEDEQNINAVLAFIEDEYLRRWLKDIIHAEYEQCDGCINDKGCVICVDGNMKETNVEPKFKVDEWVVNSQGEVWHIDSLDKKNYQVSNKGKYNYFPISKQDEMRLWTIQDAKCGDVLISPINKQPFMYNGNYTSNSLGAYFGLTYTGELLIHDSHGNNWTSLTSGLTCVHPATEEQCNILFKKLHDSDYKWYSEKKELWHKYL